MRYVLFNLNDLIFIRQQVEAYYGHSPKMEVLYPPR